jgi:hypothetical protein
LRSSIALTLAFVVALAGCASPTTKRVDVTSQQTDVEARKQMDLLAEDMVAERTRLHRVHWKLVSHSAELCPKRIQAAGVDVMALPKGELAASYSRLFGIKDEPTVLSVVPDGPADRAGIKAGDVLVSMWGLPISEYNVEVIQERARNVKARVVMPVQVRRDGRTLDLTVEPVVSCDYPAILSPQQVLNAFADGERIFITRGMMAFARTDDELALVVGHELAHNTMRHIDARKSNATAGMVGDIALAIFRAVPTADPASATRLPRPIRRNSKPKRTTSACTCSPTAATRCRTPRSSGAAWRRRIPATSRGRTPPAIRPLPIGWWRWKKLPGRSRASAPLPRRSFRCARMASPSSPARACCPARRPPRTTRPIACSARRVNARGDETPARYRAPGFPPFASVAGGAAADADPCA